MLMSMLLEDAAEVSSAPFVELLAEDDDDDDETLRNRRWFALRAVESIDGKEAALAALPPEARPFFADRTRQDRSIGQ